MIFNLADSHLFFNDLEVSPGSIKQSQINTGRIRARPVHRKSGRCQPDIRNNRQVQLATDPWAIFRRPGRGNSTVEITALYFRCCCCCCCCCGVLVSFFFVSMTSVPYSEGQFGKKFPCILTGRRTNSQVPLVEILYKLLRKPI